MMHPNDERTLRWMSVWENYHGRPVPLTALAAYREWTFDGAHQFMGRMRKAGRVGEDGRVIRDA